MKKSFALTCVLLAGSACVFAQAQPGGSTTAAAAQSKIDPAKEADIRRLLEVTGAASLAVQAMNEMEGAIRPMVTQSLPPGEYREKLVDLFFEKFRSKRDPKHLVELIVPVYDKYYTDEDVKGLIQLYQTPLGKRMLTVLPKVMAESQAAGAEWGRQLGQQSMMEVLSEHPDLRAAMEEAGKNAEGH